MPEDQEDMLTPEAEAVKQAHQIINKHKRERIVPLTRTDLVKVLEDIEQTSKETELEIGIDPDIKKGLEIADLPPLPDSNQIPTETAEIRQRPPLRHKPVK